MICSVLTQMDNERLANLTTGLRMIPADPPDTYLGVAYGMIRGVRILSDAKPTSNLALSLVSAHVLECALKAYLSKDGSDSAVRTPDVRHNLIALWRLAHKDGLNVPKQPFDWVNVLSHVHDCPYYLRYSTGVHGISVPGPEPMVTELETLLERVKKISVVLHDHES